VRLFKNAWFAKFAEKEGIGDEELKAAVEGIERERRDGGLGSGVYKRRIGRAGSGKRSGYRVIVYYRSGERAFFVYGFAKSDRDNIDDDERRKFKRTAKHMLYMTEPQIEADVKIGKLVEIV
jgi:hypothetical protein